MISAQALSEVERECAALRTRMAARRVTRLFDDALRPVGLRVTQFTLLAAIGLGRPESILQLADHLAMEHSTLTRNLRVLERRGLVHLGAEGPRRARKIQLTTGGEQTLEQALPHWRAAQVQIRQRVGEENWASTRNALRALAQV